MGSRRAKLLRLHLPIVSQSNILLLLCALLIMSNGRLFLPRYIKKNSHSCGVSHFKMIANLFYTFRIIFLLDRGWQKRRILRIEYRVREANFAPLTNCHRLFTFSSIVWKRRVSLFPPPDKVLSMQSH